LLYHFQKILSIFIFVKLKRCTFFSKQFLMLIPSLFSFLVFYFLVWNGSQTQIYKPLIHSFLVNATSIERQLIFTVNFMALHSVLISSSSSLGVDSLFCEECSLWEETAGVVWRGTVTRLKCTKNSILFFSKIGLPRQLQSVGIQVQKVITHLIKWTKIQ
jgi:hypothetical protein